MHTVITCCAQSWLLALFLIHYHNNEQQSNSGQSDQEWQLERMACSSLKLQNGFPSTEIGSTKYTRQASWKQFLGSRVYPSSGHVSTPKYCSTFCCTNGSIFYRSRLSEFRQKKNLNSITQSVRSRRKKRAALINRPAGQETQLLRQNWRSSAEELKLMTRCFVS